MKCVFYICPLQGFFSNMSLPACQDLSKPHHVHLLGLVDHSAARDADMDAFGSLRSAEVIMFLGVDSDSILFNHRSFQKTISRKKAPWNEWGRDQNALVPHSPNYYKEEKSIRRLAFGFSKHWH